jgi:hypothetical protein
MRQGRATKIAALAAAAVVFGTPASRAGDVGNVAGKDLVLDVTETTIAAQHFDARGGELAQDSGWGDWLNRLNAALRWGNWTAGLRIDSQVYWRRPIDNPNFGSLTPADQAQVVLDNESRFRTSVVPSKVWATFASRGVEVTVGDSYVQFGRGLVLLMRKIDDLGVDTTLRGVKARVEQDSFAVTAVAGFGNPSRVDEATGRALPATWRCPCLEATASSGPKFKPAADYPSHWRRTLFTSIAVPRTRTTRQAARSPTSAPTHRVSSLGPATRAIPRSGSRRCRTTRRRSTPARSR